MTQNMLREIPASFPAFDNSLSMTIQNMFQLGMDRKIPELLTMPRGKHLNLGQGFRKIGDAEPMDIEHGWNADTQSLPQGNETVTGIWANGFFEHIKEPIRLLLDCQRVLKPGGVMNIITPHGLSDLWIEDLDHVKPFSEETWRNLFANPYYDTTQKHSDGEPWWLDVHCCFIMGIAWRNLTLFTQLLRRKAR